MSLPTTPSTSLESSTNPPRPPSPDRYSVLPLLTPTPSSSDSDSDDDTHSETGLIPSLPPLPIPPPTIPEIPPFRPRGASTTPILPYVPPLTIPSKQTSPTPKPPPPDLLPIPNLQIPDSILTKSTTHNPPPPTLPHIPFSAFARPSFPRASSNETPLPVYPKSAPPQIGAMHVLRARAERNRISAEKSRRKKKDMVRMVINKLYGLKCEHFLLKNRLDKVTNVMRNLEKLLKEKEGNDGLGGTKTGKKEVGFVKIKMENVAVDLGKVEMGRRGKERRDGLEEMVEGMIRKQRFRAWK